MSRLSIAEFNEFKIFCELNYCQKVNEHFAEQRLEINIMKRELKKDMQSILAGISRIDETILIKAQKEDIENVKKCCADSYVTKENLTNY